MAIDNELNEDLDGTAVLNIAEAHFKTRLAANGGLIPIEVPEWNCVVYRPQAVSVSRMDRIIRAQEQGGLAYFVTLLIEVARTKEGKSMFKNSHRDTLMNGTATDVVIKLGTELIKSLEVDPATIEQTLTIPAPASTAGSPSRTDSATEK